MLKKFSKKNIMKNSTERVVSGIIYALIMSIATLESVLFHLIFVITLFISLYEMIKLRKNKTKFFAFLYIILPFTLIHFIDKEKVLIILILTWTFDSFAYLIGSKFGKIKIAKSISPNKSLEGFFGGMLFTVLISFIMKDIIQDLFLLAFIIPITATIGDIIESYYKRKANVKDSGNLIPGHGGMLDRVDALTISIPIIFLLEINTFK